MTIATLLSAGALILPGVGSCQSAVRAPGKAPTHPADFSGIWVEDISHRTLESVRDVPPPPYNPEWMAKFRSIHERSLRGEAIYDPNVDCLPPGMPQFDRFFYPLEILMTPGQVTLLTEYFNQTRRIFTDGRGHPSADDLEPTYRGNTIGHWEGKTLVTDTIGVRDDTILALRSPHSDQMRITERWQLKDKNTLELTLTITDPVALTGPWTRTTTLHRASPDTEIREFVCEESRHRDTYAPPAATPAKP